jgi:hypothetical protein
MPVNPEDVKIGRCFITTQEQVRRVTDITSDDRVQYEARGGQYPGQGSWGPGSNLSQPPAGNPFRQKNLNLPPTHGINLRPPFFDPPLCFTFSTPHAHVRASGGLTESCPKIGDVPKSPFPPVAALVPSAGTITLKRPPTEAGLTEPWPLAHYR